MLHKPNLPDQTLAAALREAYALGVVLSLGERDSVVAR